MNKKTKHVKATHEGMIKLGKSGEIELPCAVLENEQRVLTQSGFMKGLGRARQAKSRKYYNGDVNLPAFLTAKNLKPFISDDLLVTSSQIEFYTVKGARAYGYSADLLPQVCEVFLDAERAGVLTKSQEHIAERARILYKGLVRVGITALVDEATGYQDVRTREALQKILEDFIAKELQPWIKTFDDEFYKLIFHLNKWPYNSQTIKKRPGVIGRWTNDIVYDRLAPGVKTELHRITERDERGRLKTKLFQRLTKSVGYQKLLQHISAVKALMRASNDWRGFMRLLNRALPKQYQTLELPLPEPKTPKKR